MQTIGWHTNEDDELPLAKYREAEEQFRVQSSLLDREQEASRMVELDRRLRQRRDHQQQRRQFHQPYPQTRSATSRSSSSGGNLSHVDTGGNEFASRVRTMSSAISRSTPPMIADSTTELDAASNAAAATLSLSSSLSSSADIHSWSVSSLSNALRRVSSIDNLAAISLRGVRGGGVGGSRDGSQQQPRNVHRRRRLPALPLTSRPPSSSSTFSLSSADSLLVASSNNNNTTTSMNNNLLRTSSSTSSSIAAAASSSRDTSIVNNNSTADGGASPSSSPTITTNASEDDIDDDEEEDGADAASAAPTNPGVFVSPLPLNNGRGVRSGGGGGAPLSGIKHRLLSFLFRRASDSGDAK